MALKKLFVLQRRRKSFNIGKQMDACCTVKHACRNIYVNESRNYESPNDRAKYVPLSSPPDKHKVRWDTLTQFH